MDQTLSSLIASGLIGSVLTLLLGRVIDLFSTHQQHRLGLRKEYFSRKLDVMEKAVAFWTVSQQVINTAAMIMKPVLAEDMFYDEATIKGILDQNTQAFLRLNEKVESQAHAVRLYVDLDDDGDLAAVDNYYQSQGQIASDFFLLQFCYEKKDSETEQQYIDYWSGRIGELKSQIQQKIEQFVQASTQINLIAQRSIAVTRQSLKKYE